ncbi:glycosyl hydrolase 115 family protein [Flavobacterium sp. DG1-102-2]|uniref:glycosyl hydrolase 115 family protein n=1 Tax=Flavobacterium sp. DG1-102-2 TaxID=3081663 RepID=UPI002949DEA7|nr:glycosyl hydrolase 115 family protein [Flavobacterium sp. DG1-102-2]MDV6167142.1 glycosyl hydrolase 115 family protein [Flavobacterium sp. DG1-102-2]
MAVKTNLRIFIFCLTFLLCFVQLSNAQSKKTAWDKTLRGAWIQDDQQGVKDVILAGNGKVCEIVVGKNENSAVRQAAEFLAGDLEKICGSKPKIVESASKNAVSIRLVTLGNSDIPSEVEATSLKGKWESYQIITSGRNVWLVGSDFRGTAFAAYTLSEQLGIDPLYIWTGYRPEFHNPLVLKQTNFKADSPTFRYRGCFHDDEDILQRPFNDQGYPKLDGDISLDWYKKWFETELRLRMNMVVPYTRAHRRFEVQKIASDWGLFFTGQHYDVLVSNPFGFDRFNLAKERGVKPVWNWFTNREGMIKYWQGGIDENRDLNVIWPVGMRGLSDEPFEFPNGMTDEQKAAIFRDVIRTQVDLVTKSLPTDKTPIFTFTMYGEMFEYYQKNAAAFDLPPNVTIVWIDNNDGIMSGLPKDLGRWKHGIYYHLAYWWGPNTKQEVHTITPARIAQEFEKVVKAKATEYMLVNVSEMRDYIMGLRMISDITWNAPAIFSNPNPAEKFTAWWTREYFGSKNSNTSQLAEESYNNYFSIIDTADKLWFSSNCVEQLLGKLYEKIGNRNFTPINPDTLKILQTRIEKQDKAYRVYNSAQKALSLSQQRFFSVDVGIGMLIDYRHSQAALKLNEALNAPNATLMWQAVFEARSALEQLEVELARGEYPPFERWYHETWLREPLFVTNPHRPFNQIRSFISNEGLGSLPRSKQRWE